MHMFITYAFGAFLLELRITCLIMMSFTGKTSHQRILKPCLGVLIISFVQNLLNKILQVKLRALNFLELAKGAQDSLTNPFFSYARFREIKTMVGIRLSEDFSS